MFNTTLALKLTGRKKRMKDDRSKAILTNDQASFLDRCRAGDPEALREFVNKHYDRVFRLAYTMVGPNDASDLAQETFTAAIRSIARFRGEAQVTTWLVAILRNQYSLVLRSRKKWGHAPLEVAESTPVTETESIEPGVRAILEKFKDLPEDLRTTMVLFYLDGMKYHEIAEAMECPVGTVRSRLFDARERLKKALAPEKTR